MLLPLSFTLTYSTGKGKGIDGELSMVVGVIVGPPWIDLFLQEVRFRYPRSRKEESTGGGTMITASEIQVVGQVIHLLPGGTLSSIHRATSRQEEKTS